MNTLQQLIISFFLSCIIWTIIYLHLIIFDHTQTVSLLVKKMAANEILHEGFHFLFASLDEFMVDGWSLIGVLSEHPLVKHCHSGLELLLLFLGWRGDLESVVVIEVVGYFFPYLVWTNQGDVYFLWLAVEPRSIFHILWRLFRYCIFCLWFLKRWTLLFRNCSTKRCLYAIDLCTSSEEGILLQLNKELLEL